MINIRLYRNSLMLTASAILSTISFNAHALDILLSNDDGLTSNLVSLYKALKEQDHDIIVSVPCQGQSGMGGAIKFLKPLTNLKADCLHLAAGSGDPGAGPFTKHSDSNEYKDFYYVDGTPIMATAYGIDVLAEKRWGKNPDLIISGPNEGRNAGPIVRSSGTVNNALFAASRGIPAIAVSAGLNTKSKADSSGNFQFNKATAAVATETARLLGLMMSLNNGKTGLESSVPLNINFPDDIDSAISWKQTRVGSYSEFELIFTENLAEDAMAIHSGASSFPVPGMTIKPIDEPPTEAQLSDEGYVSLTHISVSTLHPSFEPAIGSEQWLASLIERINKRR